MTVEEYYNAAVEDKGWALELVIEFFVIKEQVLKLTDTREDLLACMDRYENLNERLLEYRKSKKGA